MLAVRASRPVASSNGYDTRLPPPAAPLTNPAPKPAAATVRTSPRDSSALRQALDEDGHALAAADAHRLDAPRLVVGPQVVDQRAHDAGAGHAERVAEGDRAAVRVQLILDGDAERVAHREHLRR